MQFRIHFARVEYKCDGESTIMLRILATYGVHELCELQPVLMKLRSASCIEYDTYYMSKDP